MSCPGAAGGTQLCALMELSCSLPAALPALKPPGSSVVTSLLSSSSALEGRGCAVSRLGLAKEIRTESQEWNLKANRNSHFWPRVSPQSGILWSRVMAKQESKEDLQGHPPHRPALSLPFTG